MEEKYIEKMPQLERVEYKLDEASIRERSDISVIVPFFGTIILWYVVIGFLGFSITGSTYICKICVCGIWVMLFLAISLLAGFLIYQRHLMMKLDKKYFYRNFEVKKIKKKVNEKC